MPFNLEYFPAGNEAAVADILFIPAANLPNLPDTDIGALITDRFSRVMYALMEFFTDLNDGLSNANLLGFTGTKGTITGVGAGTGVFNQAYTLTATSMIDRSNESVADIPVPNSGANNGIGDWTLEEFFGAGVAKVAAAANVAAVGIGIPYDDLLAYGNPVAFATLSVTNAAHGRSVLRAMIRRLAFELEVRTTTLTSAVVTNAAAAAAIAAPAAAQIASTNPTTGITAAQAANRSLLTEGVTTTLQLVLDISNQTYEVNSVVA